MEQQLQEERHRATVLQRSLDAGIAELDQEKVEKEVSISGSEVIFALWMHNAEDPFMMRKICLS